MRAAYFLVAILVVATALAGCTSAPVKSSYSVDNNGVLSVTCAPVTTTETVLFSNDTYTESRVVMHTQTGDVVTYLVTQNSQRLCWCTYREPGRKFRDMRNGW